MTGEAIRQAVSAGFETAKAGNALAAYAEAAKFHDGGVLPEKSHYAFGWIIYYAMHQSAGGAIAERKRMLSRYLSLRLVIPHKLHSMILTEAIRLYHDAESAAFGKPKGEAVKFSILGFMQLWGIGNLRPGDWRRKEFDGKPLSSTVEKLVTVCVDEIEKRGQGIVGEIAGEIVELADKALALNPDSASILSQRAALHMLSGDKEAAGRCLRRALVSAPGKFYLWSRLAATVSLESDARLHVSLLYRAAGIPGPEQFKGRVRIALARAWVALKAYGYAAWEMAKVKSLYEANGWHVPAECAAILSAIPAATAAADPEQAYREVARLADSAVYDSLPPVSVAKTYHKNPDPSGKGYGKRFVAWRVTDEEGHNYWLQPHRHGINPELPAGTKLVIRVHNGKAVKAELAKE